MANNKAIGVFDSGIGGLTAVRELIKLLPNEDIIYLGDTARVPYGTKSRETILKYAKQDFAFLENLGVKMIIAACGTVSSVVSSSESLGKSLYTGVIGPAAESAVKATKNGKIGVIGTSATIRSGSYRKEIAKLMPEAEVFDKACPMFVPLVENGYTELGCKPCEIIAEEYLSELREKGIDTLIMGCTHYPLLEEIIAKTMGSGVKLISSGGEAGKYAQKILAEKDLLNPKEEAGKITLYCTDSVELFSENAQHFLAGLGNFEIKSCTLE